MSTPSEVKSGLDKISMRISSARATVQKAQQNTGLAVADLGAIPTEFADVLATINGYDGSDTFEALAKSELAVMTAEFQALVTASNAIVDVDIG